MRILYCIPSMEGGGTERQVTYLARELVRDGCEVHVALNRGGQNLDTLEASGATVHRLGPLSNHDPRIFLRLRQLIRVIEPDVSQCWLLQMELLGGLASMSCRVPWIFSERSSAQAYPPTAKHALRIRIAAFAAAIVSNSEAGDEYWRSRVPAGVARYVIPNGLPLDEIAATPAASEAEAGTQTGEALVLWAGRLDPGKNADTLVRALARVPAGTRFKAVLCGEGPERGALESLVRELKGGDRIRIAPYVTNLWSLMKRASVLVSLSRFEGSPNVVLEAMACRCPLSVSDIAAHRALLDEESALFSAPDNVDGVAEGIVSCINDPASARRRADAAAALSERYGARSAAAQYLRIYRDVLARRRGGSSSTSHSI